MMKRMARMATRKSHSWWWDSHISPKNNKWLAENLQEMDRCVKEMLKLMEEEGDSFAKKAEMYYERRPKIVAHVEEFYRMYRALAERYNKVTGELHRNIQSELQSHDSSNGFDLGSEPPSLSNSLEVIPESEPPCPEKDSRAEGFEFCVGSSGSTDSFEKRSEEFSSSLDSDSECEDSKDASGDDMCSDLHHRIMELENELYDAMEKLQKYEGRVCSGPCEHFKNSDHTDSSARISALEKELAATDEKLRTAEAEISRLGQEFAEKNDKIIQELNENLERFKLKVDTLSTDKAELSTTVSELSSVLKSRDERIFQMNGHLHEMHLEHYRLMSEIEGARRGSNELRSRVKELEDKVDQQRMAILDSAEEKKEAIRQLCFSLEYYRDGYYQLLRAQMACRVGRLSCI